jgi:hypothetical protein
MLFYYLFDFLDYRSILNLLLTNKRNYTYSIDYQPQILLKLKKKNEYVEFINKSYNYFFKKNDIFNIKKCLLWGADEHFNEHVLYSLCKYGKSVELFKFYYSKIKDKDKDSILCLAVSLPLNRNMDIIKFLIEEGADIHTEDDYPLRHACWSRNSKIMEFLIEKGANIHVNNDEIIKTADERDMMDVIGKYFSKIHIKEVLKRKRRNDFDKLLKSIPDYFDKSDSD